MSCSSVGSADMAEEVPQLRCSRGQVISTSRRGASYATSSFGALGSFARKRSSFLPVVLASTAFLLGTRLVLQEAIEAATAWVPASGRSRPRAGLVGRRAAKADDNIDEVLVMPNAEEDDFINEPLKPQPAPQVSGKKPAIIAKRRGEQKRARNVDKDSTYGAAFGSEGQQKSIDMAAAQKAAAELDAAADSLSITKTGKSKSGRRWLLGRGGAKRRKLQENTDLENWLMSKGVWVSEKADWGKEPHGVAMAIETREQIENEVSGRGLVARRDLELYEEVAKVPLEITMNKNSSRDFFGENIITDKMSPYSAIALQLIHERSLGKESDWAPYIAVLPSTQEVGASFAWPEEEIRTTLEGSRLLNMSLYVKERVTTEYNSLRESIFEKHPDRFPTSVFTLDNFFWAYSNLFSRAVRLNYDDTPDFVALVPYIDLINHNPSANVFITGVKEGLDIPGVRSKDRFVYVKADKYYQRYEQIYLSYGPKSNAQLLMLYGFALERNPADFVEVTLSHLLENSSLVELKTDYLDLKNMERTNFPLFRDRFTMEMMNFLRLCAIEPEDFKFGAKVKQEDVTDDMIWKKMVQLDLRAAGAGLGEIVEKRVVEMLLNTLNEMLEAYPTTLEQDEQVLKDRAMFEMLPANTRMATRVKYGEKLILEASAATAERMLANIKRITELEYARAKKQRQSAQTFWGRLGVVMEDPGFRPIRNIDDLMAELGME